MSTLGAGTPRSLFLLALLGGLATFLQGCGYYSKRVECHDGCSLDISCDGKELVRKPNSGCKRDKEFKSEPTEDTCSDVLEQSHEDLTKLCWPLFSDSHSPPYRQGNTTEPPGNPNGTTTEPGPKTLTEVETDQGDGDEVPDLTTAEPGSETKADGDEVSDSTTAEPGSETKAEMETEGEETEPETEPETKAELEETLEGDETDMEPETKAETNTETKAEPETAELGPATNMETEGDLKPGPGLLQMSESASVKESPRTGSMNSHQSAHIEEHKSELGRKISRSDTPKMAVSVMTGAAQYMMPNVEPLAHHEDSPDTWDVPKRDLHLSRFLGSTLAAA